MDRTRAKIQLTTLQNPGQLFGGLQEVLLATICIENQVHHDSLVILPSAPHSNPAPLTSVSGDLDPGQRWRWVATGITAKDYIAAQWRNNPGGSWLD